MIRAAVLAVLALTACAVRERPQEQPQGYVQEQEQAKAKEQPQAKEQEPAPTAQNIVDPRFCGEPVRDANGKIARSMQVRAAFIRLHPCPATGQVTGACQKWAVDHVIPLICGGCDSVDNLQWLPNAIKSGPGKLPKDRWEMQVYCNPPRKVVLE